MSLSPEAIDALVQAGATAEMLAAVIKADLAAEAQRKARQVPWPKLRAMAFARDGNVCQYCGSTEGPFEVDHIIPRAERGEDVLENVCVACRNCNRSKKDRNQAEWIETRRAKDRDRKRRVRGVSARVRGQSVDMGNVRADSLPLSPSSPTPPLTTNPNLEPPYNPPAEADEGTDAADGGYTLPAEPKSPPDDVALAFDAWNDTARRCGLPVAKTLDDKRRRDIRRRLDDAGLDGWLEALDGVERSAFLRGKRPGRDGRTMKADLGFVCQAKSFPRLREGFYGRDLRPARPEATPRPEPAIYAAHIRHYRDTGEWKPSWGERPNLEAAE